MGSFPQISSTYFVFQAISILFMVVYPLAVALFAWRRLRVGWRYFLFGALIFFVFQLVTRVPAMLGLQVVLADTLQSSRAFTVGFLAFAAVTAGLAEEIGRYVGYRWLMRNEEKTWAKGVMFGIGHGGIESILLTGGLALIGLIGLLTVSSPAIQSQLPPEQLEALGRQLKGVSELPQWFPLLGGWERLWTLPVQVAFSVMVLQVFRRRNINWLWLAVLGHALVDFVVPGMSLVLGDMLGQVGTSLAQEAAVAVCGLIALWIIFRLRGREEPAAAEPAMPSSLPAPGSAQPGL